MTFNPCLNSVFMSVSSKKRYYVSGISHKDGKRNEIEATNESDATDVIVCQAEKFADWIREEKIIYVGLK